MSILDENLINIIEKDVDEVWANSGYSSYTTLQNRVRRRLGRVLAESMTKEEMLNFLEGGT